jgi:hypothetical protein
MSERPTTVWDDENPSLQRYWDSTAFRNLLACPYRYYLNNIRGWQTIGQKIDLEFGRIAGEGLETLYKGIIEDNLSHEQALRAALRRVLELSWDADAQGPRLGSYERVWACGGEALYKNEKGNRAKCPYAFKGKFWAAPGPETCGTCGSPCKTWDQWMAINPVKDRYQLVRLIVWYAEEVKNGYLKPLSWQEIENGPHRALVEVPWTLPLFQQDGKVFYLCGWFDAVKALGSLESEAFVTDYKTTKHTLGRSFFAPFAPDIQVSIYDLAGAELFRDVLPYRGVAIEGIQTLVGGVRFANQQFRKTDEQRAALVQELQVWIRQAIEYARAGYWPKNRASCYLCQFKEICATPDSSHETLLAAKFARARWNPLLRQQEPVDARPGPSPRMDRQHLLQDNELQPNAPLGDQSPSGTTQASDGAKG